MAEPLFPKPMSHIFVSYSHKDLKWKDQLLIHLKGLDLGGDLTIWEDGELKTGDNWKGEIRDALDAATISVLLVSPDFLASPFIKKVEVPRLLERRATEGVRILPLLLRPCVWPLVPWLEPIQCAPGDGRVMSKGNEAEIDQDFADFVTEIYNYTKDLPDSDASKVFAAISPEWIHISRLPPASAQFFGRETELARLDEAWTTGAVNIVSIVGWGGVGKSALVNAWLSRTEADNYGRAECVYGWSFYSQGYREDRQPSADQFLDSALTWFGYEGESIRSPREKGVKLAEYVRAKPTLLILDGVEPLQFPPGPMQGHLRDEGLRALLIELERSNPGMCVLSTRVTLEDFDPSVDPGVERIDLENVTPEDGAKLLKSLGVRGSKTELIETSDDFGGHALALNLLGSYLSTVHGGDIRKRDLVPELTADKEQGGHVRSVMEFYENRLAGKPELDILYMMGLFDRPARAGAIEALRAHPPIEGLTDALQGLGDAKWKYAVSNLRELRLLAKEEIDDDDALECHPLVHEHFRARLKESNPEAWREAHSRLYEYYKSLPEEFPYTPAKMEPLYMAVTHGCLAGRHQDAWDQVFASRIRRGDKHYSVTKLGLFGADLAALWKSVV